jgi:hypothetical protein
MDHSELISRLKFIGKIQKGDKINVKHMFIQPESLMTKLSRTIFNIDDRTNTFIFLTSILGKSFDLLTAQLENTPESFRERELCIRSSSSTSDESSVGSILGPKKPPKHLNGDGDNTRPRVGVTKDNFFNILSINLAQDLRNSIVGLKNLKYTYDDDKLFCCKMDVMLEEVSARLTEFEGRYDFLKDEKKQSDIEI